VSLEIITRLPPKGAPARPPLLFIHGSFASAWLWDEHFLPFFAAAGYPSHAVSLRGHGNSAGREAVDDAGLADYAADVLTAAGRLDDAPVLIGHSMGGAVALKALEEVAAAGVVLMNAVPPYGLWSSMTHLAWRRPWLYNQILLIQTLGPAAATRGAMKDLLFHGPLDAAREARFFASLQQESRRVVVDLMGFNLPQVDHAGLPATLVMGAAEDVMVPTSDVMATAKMLRADLEMLDDLGHAMMLEAEWERPAMALKAWLDRSI
jgi:pimeloyl-ACP methyl ester carboxylesterase